MDAYTALALGLTLKSTQKRKRRKWAQQWYLCRERFGHAPLLNELRISEPDVFKNFLRMDRESFDKLLDLVRPYIIKGNTVMRCAISPFERHSITLRFLATGNTFEDLKFLSAISPQAIGGIVIDTCTAINTCLQSYIKMPQTAEERKELSNDFNKHWNIPHCVGALDGKHVSIKKPIASGSFYYNYKKHFSIVLLAVVNAKYEFIMVDAGMNGRVSDGGVMSHTNFSSLMEHGELQLSGAEPLHGGDSIDVPYFFVADEAFAMNENLLKPYSAMGNNVLDQERRIFNYRLSRGQSIVENVFGIRVSRYGVFQRPMMLAPEKATTVTLTCCYLHNFNMLLST
ncbi:putative nuclease HARBI1 [Palaemon carinicauda]|uniref:putative nuclease HARBI1 n=1 Tax=Palaemon carinicauda TaxID=392227 RepID=UPI0035B63922